MKKILFLIYAIFCMSFTPVFAQLPPAAQALYDSAFVQDSLIVNYALNNGAQIIATPDGNSFYIKWFPTGSTPSTTPVIVTLHGSSGYAFHEFYTWHSQAQLHGCGIIALQWYRPNQNPPNDYFPDETLYSYIDSALTDISYPSGKAFLHGFSRGSARSYALVFNDIQSGNNYFCTVMSNSGGATPTYPLYAQIDSGLYGNNVFFGKHWNLFCGGQDPDSLTSGCIGMTYTQAWLQGQGAIVDIFIQDQNLGHNGFVIQPSFAYRDSILDNYLLCYNGTLSVGKELNKTNITIFPNPFSSQTILKANGIFKNASLTVYNAFGQQVKQINNIKGETVTLYRDNLPSGLYFFRVIQDNKTISTNKLIITD